MSATATTEKKYLKWYQKLAYGSGDLASNCSYGLVSSLVLLCHLCKLFLCTFQLSCTQGLGQGIGGRV